MTETIANPRMPITTPLADEEELRQLEETWRKPWGVWGWLTTTNHKDIGLRFIYTAMTFFTFAGLLALGVRIQLAVPSNHFLGPDRYNQFFTTHGSAMMFLFAVPIMEGFGLYLVPLMIGTRNVAFPKLMAYAYYCYLFAGLGLFVSLIFDMGPDMGWFAYTPLSGPSFSPGHRVDIWSQMVTLVELSSLASAVDLIVTILKERAPGMSLNRMPIFVWAQLVVSFMMLFSMPAVMLCSTMLSTDRLANIGTHFYNHVEGGDHLLWQHLFWFFAHPEVYIIFIPATGFVSAIIPTFTRRRMYGYTPLVLSMTATAFIGFGVWVHHMFVTPLPELGQSMFTASSMMIVIPNGVQMFCWLATIWGGKPRIKLPFVWVLGFVAVFMIGGLSGVMLASIAIDSQVHDTMFVVAHLHYVLIGGAVFPLFGAFYYWYPKWTGRMLGTKLGYLNFALMFIGFNLTFWPLHHLGLHGMPRRVYTYPAEMGWGTANFIATIGAMLQGLSVLVFYINVLVSRRHGKIAGANPWFAGTFEWATESPPPRFNFQHLPTCQGREPVWENQPDAPVVTGLRSDIRELLSTTTLDAEPHHRYDIANDSITPFLLGCATAYMLLGGGIFHPKHAVYAAIAVTVFLWIWFWASGKKKPGHESD